MHGRQVREPCSARRLLSIGHNYDKINRRIGQIVDDRLGAKSGLAAALAETVTDDSIDELIVLAKDRSHGSSRLLLLRGLRRSRAPAAKKALEELASDPELSKEIASWRRVRRTPTTRNSGCCRPSRESAARCCAPPARPGRRPASSPARQTPTATPRDSALIRSG